MDMIYNGEDYVAALQFDMGEGYVARVSVRIAGDNDPMEFDRVRSWVRDIFSGLKEIPLVVNPPAEKLVFKDFDNQIHVLPDADLGEVYQLKTEKSLALWTGLALGALSTAIVWATVAGWSHLVG